MILGISTSLSQFCITLSESDHVFYKHQVGGGRNQNYALGELLSRALTETGKEISAVSSIVSDIGPGGTSSVRSAVSFANGLAYSLGIPVAGISSAEIIGTEASSKHGGLVAILYKSISNNHFCAFFLDGKVEFLHTTLEDISQYIVQRYSRIILAGNLESMVTLQKSLTHTDSIISNVHKAEATILGKLSCTYSAHAQNYPQLIYPITELNYMKWNQDTL